MGLERTKSNAEEAYNKSFSISFELGLALALDKSTPLSQSLVWLDISIDALSMTVLFVVVLRPSNI